MSSGFLWLSSTALNSMCRQYTVDVVCRRLGYSEYGDPTKVPGHCSPHFLFFLLSLSLSSSLALFSCLPMCLSPIISSHQVVQLLEEPIRCELGPGQVLINHPNVCVIQMVHGHVCSKSDSGLGQVSRMSRQPSRHQCCARHIPTQVQIYINRLSRIIRRQQKI